MVVEDRKPLLKEVADGQGLFRLSVFAQQGKDAHGDRCQTRVQAQDNAGLVVLYVFVVSVAEQDEQDAVHPDRRFDNVG